MVWITATSRTAILAGYAEAAARITGIDDTEPERAAARLLSWLSEQHQRTWLIVLDNLDDPNDLTGLWPPNTTGGHTVVTTRRRDAALITGRQTIDVSVFTSQQAGAYLHNKLTHQPYRLNEASQLAADLGHLPLGLSQAVAYILDRGPRMDCARYRELLADERRRLADIAPDALPDQHRDIVAATWSLSIDRADHLAPAGLARPILELAALLDPNGVPQNILTAAPIAAYCTERVGRTIDADDLDDALHTLHRFSLLTIDEPATVRMHALLQRAVRDHTDADRRAQLAVLAADALLELWPRVERNAGHAQDLRANTDALNTHAGTHLCNIDRGTHPILPMARNSLGGIGLVRLAANAFEELLEDELQVLGPDHPDTLTTRHSLAHWHGEAGDPAGAAAALQQLVDDRRRVLGPDHPDTLTSRHSLAFWWGRAGDAAGAAEALEQVLDDDLRVLGPDHPDTLMTRHYLGRWLGEAGNPAVAATTLQQVLDDRLRILGPDHPHTLMTRHNLARWRGEGGDPAAAAADLQQLLIDRLRVLGPDHPATLATRGSLALWLGEAGDPDGAAAALHQLLEDDLRILGPDHYHTLATRDDLSYWKREAAKDTDWS